MSTKKKKKADPAAQAAFARFIEVIGTEAGRVDFTEHPDDALGPTAAANLPPELKGFLEALSVEELGLLYRLSKRTRAEGLYATYGAVTVCHL